MQSKVGSLEAVVLVRQKRPTKRALDGLDSARFLDFFLSFGSFLFSSFSLPSRAP
jgi:hypothetical protein